MIEVRYGINANKIAMEIGGHAQYSEEGTDIVCASVSMIVIGLAHYLMDRVEPHEVELSEDKNITKYLELTTSNPAPREVMLFCINTLKLLEEQYPDYIQMVLSQI